MTVFNDANGSQTGPTCDVCVAGGGPAGLVLAFQLAKSGRQVTLLESGPGDGSAQDLSQAEVAGDKVNALNLQLTRHRDLGGNANAWSIKTDQDDNGWVLGPRYGSQTNLAVGDRPWINATGWPLETEELTDWTRQAHDLLAMGDYNYDEVARETAADIGLPSFSGLDEAAFDRRLFSFGPSHRFTGQLREELMRHDRVDVIQGATVVKLHQSAAGAPVESVTYAEADGKLVNIKARSVVLAGGGVENARVLLNSETERGGIGNENDNVGRYFMDHPLWAAGHIKLHDIKTLPDYAFFDFRSVNGATRHGHLVTSRAWCEENQATEIGVMLLARPKRRVGESIDNLKYLATNPKHYLKGPKELLKGTGKVVAGLDQYPRGAMVARKQSLLPGIGRGGWSEAEPTTWFRELEVLFQTEQPPLRDSRVTLSDKRDRFGVPLPKLTWHLGAQAEQSAIALQRLIAARVTEQSIGRYMPSAGNLDALAAPTSIAHHMGSTRMSVKAEDGVVDSECRVHTCPNLYIAGSSVFPVGGYVNPTLTIGALSMRLADTLGKTSTA